MRATFVAVLAIPFAAGPLAAKDIVLGLPIDCDLDGACYVQQYVDHDPSNGAMDFRCSNLSYQNHSGTDFALLTIAQMQRGVDVIAAAPGTVRATRDGMQDAIFDTKRGAQVEDRECGNAVVIDHDDGWSTQYCHMKRGSIAVQKGDSVGLSAVLGQVGLSGRTQFPHLHLTVRKDGTVIDPFDPDGVVTCGAPSTETLWQSPPPYRPGGVLEVGFADRVPKYDDVKAGRAASATLPKTTPAIVVFGNAFGGKAGDRMHLRIDGPEGVVMNETVVIDQDQAQFFRAVGKKRRSDWTTGTYRGIVTLLRGTRIISSEQGSVVVR